MAVDARDLAKSGNSSPTPQYEKRNGFVYETPQAGFTKTDAQGRGITYDTWVRDYENQERKKQVYQPTEFEKLRGEIQTLSEKSRAKENELKGALLTATGESTAAIDKLLASLIDQTGYTTGLTKQAIGSQMSDRGILRSGQTAQSLQGADVAKQSNIGNLVTQRNEQVAKVKEAQTSALRGIEDRRFVIEQELKAAEMAGFQDLAYQEKQMKAKMELEQFIGDLQLSSLSTQALFGAIGGLAQLAGIGVGYAASKPATPTATVDYNKLYNA